MAEDRIVGGRIEAVPPLANPCRPGAAGGAAGAVNVGSTGVLVGLAVVGAIGTGLYFLLRP